MKKALIEMDLEYHTVEDFAKALGLMRFEVNGDIPLDDLSASYCKAVFRDVKALLTFYEEVCDACLDCCNS